MLPETIHSSVQSTAERRLFETIRDAPNTDHWLCLHSLGLAHHATKRRAEIDFVLLTHHGIFILEAKAGRLKRRKGIWYSVDKQDVPHQLPESPFDQVLPEHAALVASDRDDQRFDVLVVDEAEDIFTSQNLDALNEMLRGGLENGRWCFFLDGRPVDFHPYHGRSGWLQELECTRLHAIIHQDCDGKRRERATLAPPSSTTERIG